MALWVCHAMEAGKLKKDLRMGVQLWKCTISQQRISKNQPPLKIGGIMTTCSVSLFELLWRMCKCQSTFLPLKRVSLKSCKLSSSYTVFTQMRQWEKLCFAFLWIVKCKSIFGIRTQNNVKYHFMISWIYSVNLNWKISLVLHDLNRDRFTHWSVYSNLFFGNVRDFGCSLTFRETSAALNFKKRFGNPTHAEFKYCRNIFIRFKYR